MVEPYPFKKAKVSNGEDLFVEFWAWSHSKDELSRKRIYSIAGTTKKEKLKNARKLASHINLLLEDGHTLADGAEDQENDVLAPLKILTALKKATALKSKSVSKTHSKQFRTLCIDKEILGPFTNL